MRKRQLKKFAKKLPNLKVYREAKTKSTKAFRRRWSCMKRYWKGVKSNEDIVKAFNEYKRLKEMIERTYRKLKDDSNSS